MSEATADPGQEAQDQLQAMIADTERAIADIEGMLTESRELFEKNGLEYGTVETLVKKVDAETLRAAQKEFDELTPDDAVETPTVESSAPSRRLKPRLRV